MREAGEPLPEPPPERPPAEDMRIQAEAMRRLNGRPDVGIAQIVEALEQAEVAVDARRAENN